MNHLPENPEEAEPQPDQGFLQRWSQRKAADAGPERPDSDQADDSAPDDNALEPLHTDDASENDDNALPVLTDEDMQPLETLNADSDYAPFMSEGVSSELRQLALKKLFFSGLFGQRDGLDDYDDDFTKFEPLGDTITSDMKFHMRREEKARLAKEEAEREAEALAAGAETPEQIESTAETEDESGDTESGEAAGDRTTDTDNPADESATPDEPVAEDQLASQKSDEQTGKKS